MNAMTIRVYNDDDEEVEHKIPAKYEVCSRCYGEGKHVDPNIDGDGITGSEWAELCDGDPDFPDDYMSGKFDVTCEECNGLRVVPAPDEEHMTDAQKELVKEWYEQQDRESSFDYEDAYTRRMESGY